MGDIRRLFTAGAVVVAVMALGAAARADYKTGNTLYADCTSNNLVAGSFCSGYVAAISDASASVPRGPRLWSRCVHGYHGQG